MIKVVYSVFLLASLVNLSLLIARNHRKISSYFVLLFGSQLIINLGYIENPVTIYLGACFFWFFLLMCFSEICHFSVNLIVQFICAGLCSVSFLLALLLGIDSPVFRISYYAIAALSVIADLYIILTSFHRSRQVSYITSRSLLIALILSLAAIISAKVLHVEMPLLLATISASQIVLLCVLERIRRNDVETVAGWLQPGENIGYVVIREIDGKQYYINSNKQACSWFPELKTLWIERELGSNTKIKAPILKKLRTNMKDNCPESQKTVNAGDSRLTIEVIEVQEKKGILYLFCLRDETERLKAEEELQQQEDKVADLKAKAEDYEKKIQDYKKEIRELKEEKDEASRINALIEADIITGLGNVIENRDGNTGGHVERTSEVMNIFLRQLRDNNMLAGYKVRDIKRIERAAPLHDLGKIAIPDGILNKNGKPDEDEWKVIKTHPEKGVAMVKILLKHISDKDLKRVASNMVLYHHEKWDGSGYPTHLSKKSIPLEARIMAIVDVFDALVSKRSYKEAMEYEKAFGIIKDGAGTHFDPTLVAEFLECRKKIEEYYNTITQKQADSDADTDSDSEDAA